jgi:hypothetical protein
VKISFVHRSVVVAARSRRGTTLATYCSHSFKEILMKRLICTLIAGVAIGGCVMADDADEPETTTQAEAMFLEGIDLEDCGLEPWLENLEGEELILEHFVPAASDFDNGPVIGPRDAEVQPQPDTEGEIANAWWRSEIPIDYCTLPGHDCW